MKFQKINRRRFLLAAALSLPFAVAGDARLLEPTWVKTRNLRLSAAPTHRFVHITDLHYKGDREYLQSVVEKINSLAPDFVCFTGDIMEQKNFLSEALEILSALKSPIFGAPLQ